MVVKAEEIAGVERQRPSNCAWISRRRASENFWVASPLSPFGHRLGGLLELLRRLTGRPGAAAIATLPNQLRQRPQRLRACRLGRLRRDLRRRLLRRGLGRTLGRRGSRLRLHHRLDARRRRGRRGPPAFAVGSETPSRSSTAIITPTRITAAAMIPFKNGTCRLGPGSKLPFLLLVERPDRQDRLGCCTPVVVGAAAAAPLLLLRLLPGMKGRIACRHLRVARRQPAEEAPTAAAEDGLRLGTWLVGP